MMMMMTAMTTTSTRSLLSWILGTRWGDLHFQSKVPSGPSTDSTRESRTCEKIIRQNNERTVLPFVFSFRVD